MKRTFKTVNYEQALDLTVRLGDCLPPEHLARFVVDSVALLDVSALYAHYGSRGGEPYAPEVLLGLLFYGYATGVFSSRKIERATYEAVPFRFIAGNQHPDHDTLATFRRTFLPELKDLFVQVLLLAQEAGVLKLGTISLDGTKMHADASRHKAVSYKRLLEMETQLRAEIEELFKLMGWWCVRRWRGERTAWYGWRKPKRCCKLVPASGWLPNRRSMRPGWRSARSESARRGVALVVARRPRRCQEHAPATSTTSPTQSRA
jgi:transposase